MVSTSRRACPSPRWSRRCGRCSAGSRTLSRGRRHVGCSPCWIRTHRGVGRRRACWTTSPRSCSRRRLPAVAGGPGGHALGGPFDPGLRVHAVSDRPWGTAVGADVPQRRAPSPPSVPEDRDRDQPDPRGPAHRPRRVGPRQHRGNRRQPAPTGRPTRRWSTLCWRGPRATRCTPRSSSPPTRPATSRGPGPPVGSAVGPDRRPRRRPAGAAPPGLGQRHPAGHRHARRLGGTRPGPDGGVSAGGAGRQCVAPGRRVSGVPASVVA